jgi:D-alanyl-D-alanine dipeptidase
MRAIRFFRFVVSAAAALALASSAAAEDGMPEGFVYLRDIDASIVQEMRYAGPHNFTGRPVPGYGAAECVLVRQAAEALKAVQAALEPRGLGLKVYDCYRPAQAVAAFVAWAEEPDDAAAKRAYYPSLPKSALFPDYIATRSGHSRGATVDLTLMPLNAPEVPETHRDPVACTEGAADETSLDMGTAFDCFDPKANTEAPGIAPEQARNRKLLVDVMARHGFKNYPMEFWHYTFQPEPFPQTYFDFPILPRNAGERP